jgi:hemin uptake protein HemP
MESSVSGSGESDNNSLNKNEHVVQSEELLHGQREVQIVHGTEVYRLLVTRNNKLILQK